MGRCRVSVRCLRSRGKGLELFSDRIALVFDLLLYESELGSVLLGILLIQLERVHGFFQSRVGVLKSFVHTLFV